MTDRYVICDIDGTLANPDHRIHFVQCKKPDFESFYAGCPDDVPNEWCLQLIQAMRVDHKIMFVSARREDYEGATWRWLDKHVGGTGYDLHVLRGLKDSTPDEELKVEWLRSFGKEKILFWIDDRQKVVDAIRAEGVTVLQCSAWKEVDRRAFKVGGTI